MLITELEKFGARELSLATKLLNAISNGYPKDFDASGVKIAFNPYSGDVFLTNDDYQTCIEVDGELFSYYSTPYNGIEGTFDDLLDQYEEMCNEDKEYIKELARMYYPESLEEIEKLENE